MQEAVNARLIMTDYFLILAARPGYASNSVYGDLTCNDSLPQLSTATPNAFCNVKPTRYTGLLSPAM